MTDTAAHTVLVVDDNEWNRDILSRRLERKGFDVLSAGDGAAALALVAEQPVDLVLLDIMMPGISGLEVLRTLRETHTAAQLPIIMATAKDGSEDVVEALELGANDYVTKPLDFAVVLARVKTQLRAKRPAKLGPEPAPEPPPGTGGPQEIGPGSTLAGKYVLEDKIGSGNFGTVYRSRHVGLDHPVAVKVLQSAVGATPEAVARFQREGISACRIAHPNAVSVLDFVATDAITFLVMELLEGHTLADELKRDVTLRLERCAEIVLPICEVLEEAHRAGIIHRDIKPANIFLQQTRRGEVVKVLDFGIAKLVGDAAHGQHLTIEGWVLGTPAYMAPERFGNRPYEGKADVYSVGVMLYQMIAGRTPFVTKSSDLMAMVMMHLQEAPKPLREVVPEVPEAVAEVVHSALRKTPEERPGALAFAEAFCRALAASTAGEAPSEATFITPSASLPWPGRSPSFVETPAAVPLGPGASRPPSPLPDPTHRMPTSVAALNLTPVTEDTRLLHRPAEPGSRLPDAPPAGPLAPPEPPEPPVAAAAEPPVFGALDEDWHLEEWSPEPTDAARLAAASDAAKREPAPPAAEPPDPPNPSAAIVPPVVTSPAASVSPPPGQEESVLPWTDSEIMLLRDVGFFDPPPERPPPAVSPEPPAGEVTGMLRDALAPRPNGPPESVEAPRERDTVDELLARLVERPSEDPAPAARADAPTPAEPAEPAGGGEALDPAGPDSARRS